MNSLASNALTGFFVPSAEGFISAQLDERLDVLAEKKTGVCLEAKLSYHPALQLCSWQDPDGNVYKCTETWATKHR